MNLYILSWTVLIAISLWVSLAAFFWALRHGQFREQERARFLPLRGEEGPAPPKRGNGGKRESCVLFGILLLGAASIIAALLTMIFTTGVKP